MRQDTPPQSPGNCTDQYEDNEIEEDFEDYELEYVEELEDVGAEELDQEEENENIIDLAKIVFKQHSDAVFCGKFSPNGNLAVTGGQDDVAYVWCTETGALLFECSGHNESVIEAMFNFDGTYVATADMNGCVKVWKPSTQKLYDEYSTGSEIIWMYWHPGGNIIFAGCKDGDTYMWRLPMTEFKVLYGNGFESSCGIILSDGKRLAVGYADGIVKIWDLKNAKALHTIKQNESSSSAITCIDSYNDNNLIIAGDENGSLIVIKTSNGNIVGSLTAEYDGPIESVKFGIGVSNGIVASGSKSKLVFWDIAKQTIRTSISLDEHDGVSRLVWKSNGILYVGGTYSGVIYVFDGRSGQEIKRLTGHKEMILDVSLTKDESKLLTCSNDCTARIFEISSSQ